MLSCKDITALASDSLDRDLPLAARMQMRLHLLICKHCARYVEQIKRLSDLAGAYAEQLEGRPESLDETVNYSAAPKLDDDGKARLQRALESQQKAK